ncbi:butyrophilin subfamily 2 member A2-like [Garra rufa]|uniref:butyrophilin subfamily 2 member A2-like n=1 Tax=Garra rufa TaxID=137080 RepID=UPI003CCE93F7
MLSIIIALLVNVLIETSVSFTVVVPGDPVVSHVGSTVILSCRISPPENAEALEIRWYRQDQFSNPVLLYNHGKIQDIQEESYRSRTSFTLWSDQSGGLKDGDVSLRLEKLTLQDEGLFLCYVSGDTSYDSREVLLKITDQSDSSGLWKALFLIVLTCAFLGLVGMILYKYRDKLTGKKPTKEIVGEVNIEELRKHAVQITFDQQNESADVIVSHESKSVRVSDGYKHNREGFPYHLCALGANKFSSGRHYWEVDLAITPNPPKDSWLIGVMKPVNFNQAVIETNFTPSSGFWFLCSDGPNGFHTNYVRPVTFSPRPERLGVLLDYGKGQLSFYNVKERKHLLTISTSFSGSVVPLFNPGVGDQSQLRILDCPEPLESAEESSQPLLSNMVSAPDKASEMQHVRSKPL